MLSQYIISFSLQPYKVGPSFILKIDDELSSEWLSNLLEVTQLVSSTIGIHLNSLQI